MNHPGGLRSLVLLALGLASIAQASCRRAQPVLAPEAPALGLYHGSVAPATGREQRFRLLLFATPPDRLHAEVVSPLGSTELILDGGAGRLAVTLVRDGVSYVGPARREALERVLGLALSLEQLVDALFTGAVEAGAACNVALEPGPRAGLPERIAFEQRGVRLVLQLKRLRPLTGIVGELGSGTPPPGIRTLPLEQLEDLVTPRPLAGELEP